MPTKIPTTDDTAPTNPSASDSAPAVEPHFSVHASVVFQLGESLISDVVQALVELVKNAYDADAKTVFVEVNTSDPLNGDSAYPGVQGYVIVDDTGTGMDLDAINFGWLTISNSPKREMKRLQKTSVLGRTPLGDKGLGRLGTQRLGRNLEIYTRPAGSAIEHYVAFSWSDFKTAARLEDVPVTVRSYPAKRKKGTRLVISDLVDKRYWIDNGAEKLQTDLSQMISPYKNVGDFQVGARFDGKDLDLIQFTESIRRTAQLHYTINFDGEILNVTGRARLDFFRPENPREKEEFRVLVDVDQGEDFYQFLSTQKRAQEYLLGRSKKAGWFVEYNRQWIFSALDKMLTVPKEAITDRADIQEKTSEHEVNVELQGDPPPEKNGMVKANPGPFKGEVDAFDLGKDYLERQSIVDNVKDFRSLIKNISGVRVYRDGFGIRVEEDFLQLGKDWTSASSYYGLKPGSTIGFIELTARDNPNLEEKTDREGFKKTPYYDNFYDLIRLFTAFTSDAQDFIRRGYVKFKSERQKKLAGIEAIATPTDVALRLNRSLAKAATYKEGLEGLQKNLGTTELGAQHQLSELESYIISKPGDGKQVTAAIESVKQTLIKAERSAANVEKYLGEVVTSGHAVKYLESQIQMLQEQIHDFYDTMSLGLTAEVLSHEIHNISDQLARRTQQIMKHLRETTDPRLVAYLGYVNSAVNELRRQLRHLAPSLRYVREKKEPIDVVGLLEEVTDYHRSRFEGDNIEVKIEPIKTRKFVLLMNKGKLVQILDNIFLNSEYWIREDLRLERIKRGIITVEIDKPFIRIRDNAEGIDPKIETSLFEPFVTTKGKQKGRGLGLFIVKQLLDSEACTISLLPKRNRNKRFYIFEINLSGALNER